MYHRTLIQQLEAPPSVEALPHATAAQTAPVVGVMQVWREALVTFAAHAVPMLTLAAMGFAGVPILGALAYVVAALVDSHLQKPPDVLILIEAVAGAFVLPFTRGAITWIALHDVEQSCGMALRNACATAWHNLPRLMLGWLVYTVFIVAGATGLNTWLRHGQLDSDALVLPAPARDESMVRAILALDVDALTPDPFAPLAGVLPRLRAKIYAATIEQDVLRRLRSNRLKHTVSSGLSFTYSTSTSEFWLAGFGGIVLIFIGETLFRLYSTMTMSDKTTTFLTRCIFVARHAGTVFVHTWFMRLVIFAALFGCVIPYTIFTQSIFVPKLIPLTGIVWMPAISTVVLSSETALLSAIYTAFGAVYDARLYAALGKGD